LTLGELLLLEQMFFTSIKNQKQRKESGDAWQVSLKTEYWTDSAGKHIKLPFAMSELQI